MTQLAGKLIVIDGIDGAGKTTQTTLLVKRLSEQKVRCEHIHFPCYDTFFGGVVRRFLDGEFGQIDEVSPYLASIVYALDRWDMMVAIRRHLEQGTHVILDRYISSNLAHQGAKLADASERDEFLSFASSLEYDRLNLVKEDAVFLLDTPPAQARLLVEARGDKLDILEANEDYQSATYELYLKLSESHDHWQTIESIGADGSVRSIEQIHKSLLAHVQEVIAQRK